MKPEETRARREMARIADCLALLQAQLEEIRLEEPQRQLALEASKKGLYMAMAALALLSRPFHFFPQAPDPWSLRRN